MSPVGANVAQLAARPSRQWSGSKARTHYCSGPWPDMAWSPGNADLPNGCANSALTGERFNWNAEQGWCRGIGQRPPLLSTRVERAV